MTFKRMAAIVFGAAWLAVGLGFGIISAGTYVIAWDAIDGGGGRSTSAIFELTGTAGQPDAGFAMTGDDYELTGGFWSEVGLPAPRPDCALDIAPKGGDGVVGIGELLMVVGDWGSPKSPADVAPPGGDGMVDIADLLAILGAWGVCP